VALAEATDLPTAARTTGIPSETIARWMDEAPDQSDLERARDLAQADLTAKLAMGETRGIRDLAVVVGIMRDKIQRASKAPEPERPSWGERLDDWIDATYPPGHRELARRAHDRWSEDELHRLEAAVRHPQSPTDEELQAWAEANPEVVADGDGDIDDVMLRESQAFLRSIPDLAAWIAEWEARDEAQRARHRVVTARADVLRGEGGLHWHEALQPAEDITA
jgi:hypothetical protein